MNLSKLFTRNRQSSDDRDLHPYAGDWDKIEEEEEDNSPMVEDPPYGYYYCHVCGLVPIDRFPNCHPNSRNVQQRW